MLTVTMLQVVRRLLHKGVDKDAVDSDEMSAAMLATVCQQEHCATFINMCQSVGLIVCAS